MEGMAVVEFTDADVVRHPLVARVVQAYDRRDRRLATQRRKKEDE
jgi:phosphate starvation-inducible PhoH-like protein